MFVGINQLNEVIAKLANTGEYGLDTEATGLAWRDRVFSIIISDEDESYYFNFQDYPGLNSEYVLPRTAILKLQQILGNSQSTFFIHNAKFDWNMLAKEGLRIDGWVWCTHSLERVIKNNHFPETLYNLDNCAKRNLGKAKDDAVEAFIEKNSLFTRVKVPGKKKIEKIPHYDRVPFEIIAPYAMKDASLHRELGLWQKQELRRLALVHPPRGTLPSIMNIAENELRLTRTCAKMEYLGVKVDVPYIEEAIGYETAQQNIFKSEFVYMTGMQFEDGPKTLGAAFQRAGLTPGMTAKGNPSFTADVLESMDSPLANCINSIRKIEKRLGTYYSSFLHLRDDQDVLHPNIKQSGTETGRFSYSNPNLQNVPKEEKSDSPFLIRKCFIPRPGKTFVAIDYKQQEFRLLLDYAGEHQLIAEINAGADVHQATADTMGVSRSAAKTINFMLLYGGGTAKLAHALGVTEQVAGELKQAYFGKLPGVKKFLAAVQRVGKQRGYVCNTYGRVCHLADPDFAYALVNHIIQGTGADTIKISMNNIDENVPQAPMVLQVHDELIFELEPKQFNLIPKIQTIMENTYRPQNGMRLLTSVAHSAVSWAHRDMVEGAPCI